MPNKSGLEVLASVVEKDFPTKIILLTMYKNPGYFYKAVSLGAKGYLSKEDAVSEIIQSIEMVSLGGSYISTSLSKLLVGKEKSKDEIQTNLEAVSSLTHMEKEVLKLIAEWKTNNEIAGIIGYSKMFNIENMRQEADEITSTDVMETAKKYFTDNNVSIQILPEK